MRGSSRRRASALSTAPTSISEIGHKGVRLFSLDQVTASGLSLPRSPLDEPQ
jgi:hypothetical protein